LAEKMGINNRPISRLENDDYNPSVELLSKIAEALDKELVIKFMDLK